MPPSPARRCPGVSQGPGRRWPKKKPSGSDSEEEEQVGQGLSSLGFPGARGASLSGLPDSPLGVSKVRLAPAEGSAAREVILSCEEARFQPTPGPGPSSPVANGSEMPISEPPSPCARGGPRVACGLPPRPGLCRARHRRRQSAPGAPASVHQWATASPSRERVGAAAPPGGFRRPLERAGQGRAVSPTCDPQGSRRLLCHDTPPRTGGIKWDSFPMSVPCSAPQWPG